MLGPMLDRTSRTSSSTLLAVTEHLRLHGLLPLMPIHRHRVESRLPDGAPGERSACLPTFDLDTLV